MKTVLVADDNPVSRELVLEALAGDYLLIEAADGRETVARIRDSKPDLALVDIRMPCLDGYGVLAEVRADPDLSGTVLVALTSFAMEGDREKALGAGFDAYITKPVSLAGLREELRLLLRADSHAGSAAG